MKRIEKSEISHLLIQCHHGDPSAADQLMPLVYEELRKLAAARIAQERPGLTLQATALVHEAYVRLVKSDDQVTWDSRGHFFAAAAEAMRRIMIDRARRKNCPRHGGDRKQLDLELHCPAATETPDRLLAWIPIRAIDLKI